MRFNSRVIVYVNRRNFSFDAIMRVYKPQPRPVISISLYIPATQNGSFSDCETVCFRTPNDRYWKACKYISEFLSIGSGCEE